MPVVGFAFGLASIAPEQGEQLIANLEAIYGRNLYDSKAIISVEAHASRPGSQERNQQLTERRADAVVRLLRQAGVQGQVEVRASGEEAARTGGTRMALDRTTAQPSDQEPRDEFDNAEYRVATVRVDFDQQATDVVFEESDDLTADLRDGARLTDDLLRPEAERIRAKYPLEPNPFGEDPSSDPEVFIRQVGTMGKKAVRAARNPAKLLAAQSVALGYEALVRTRQRQQVRDRRQPLHQAQADGLAAGIAPGSAPPPPADPAARQVYERVRDQAAQLSEAEKHKVAMYLNEQYRLGDISRKFEAPSYEAIEDDELEGGSLAGKAASFIEANRRWTRE